MTGEYLLNTDRLRKFLGESYEDVIRYSIADAFADCFQERGGCESGGVRGWVRLRTCGS